MMFVIFNNMGGIKFTSIKDYVMKGSIGINHVMVAIEDSDRTAVCNANFLVDGLPEITTSTVVGVPCIFNFDGKNYNGWDVALGAAQTAVEGTLHVSINLVLTGSTDYQYQFDLVVNPSVLDPRTEITNEEKKQLEELLSSSYQLNFINTNVRAYSNFDTLYNDFQNNLVDGQVVHLLDYKFKLIPKPPLENNAVNISGWFFVWKRGIHKDDGLMGINFHVTPSGTPLPTDEQIKQWMDNLQSGCSFISANGEENETKIKVYISAATSNLPVGVSVVGDQSYWVYENDEWRCIATRNYVDREVSTEREARIDEDERVQTELTDYIDEEIETERSSRIAGDEETLSAAEEYADTKTMLAQVVKIVATNKKLPFVPPGQLPQPSYWTSYITEEEFNLIWDGRASSTKLFIVAVNDRQGQSIDELIPKKNYLITTFDKDSHGNKFLLGFCIGTQGNALLDTIKILQDGTILKERFIAGLELENRALPGSTILDICDNNESYGFFLKREPQKPQMGDEPWGWNEQDLGCGTLMITYLVAESEDNWQCRLTNIGVVNNDAEWQPTYQFVALYNNPETGKPEYIIKAIADSSDTTTKASRFFKFYKYLILNEENAVMKSQVVDNLTSTATDVPLSAKQGKVLNDTKQVNLVSGNNIKTLNGLSLLGSGNITIGEDIPIASKNYIRYQNGTFHLNEEHTDIFVYKSGTENTTVIVDSGFTGEILRSFYITKGCVIKQGNSAIDKINIDFNEISIAGNGYAPEKDIHFVGWTADNKILFTAKYVKYNVQDNFEVNDVNNLKLKADNGTNDYTIEVNNDSDFLALGYENTQAIYLKEFDELHFTVDYKIVSRALQHAFSWTGPSDKWLDANDENIDFFITSKNHHFTIQAPASNDTYSNAFDILAIDNNSRQISMFASSECYSLMTQHAMQTYVTQGSDFLATFSMDENGSKLTWEKMGETYGVAAEVGDTKLFGGTKSIEFVPTDFSPSTNNEIDLGKSTKRFKKAYVNNLDVSGAITGASNVVKHDQVVNALNSTSATNPLSANMGKLLYDNKQNKLVSGTSIKSINGESLLGSGDIGDIVKYTHDASTDFISSTAPNKVLSLSGPTVSLETKSGNTTTAKLTLIKDDTKNTLMPFGDNQTDLGMVNYRYRNIYGVDVRANKINGQYMPTGSGHKLQLSGYFERIQNENYSLDNDWVTDLFIYAAIGESTIVEIDEGFTGKQLKTMVIGAGCVIKQGVGTTFTNISVEFTQHSIAGDGYTFENDCFFVGWTTDGIMLFSKFPVAVEGLHFTQTVGTDTLSSTSTAKDLELSGKNIVLSGNQVNVDGLIACNTYTNLETEWRTMISNYCTNKDNTSIELKLQSDIDETQPGKTIEFHGGFLGDNCRLEPTEGDIDLGSTSNPWKNIQVNNINGTVASNYLKWSGNWAVSNIRNGQGSIDVWGIFNIIYIEIIQTLGGIGDTLLTTIIENTGGEKRFPILFLSSADTYMQAVVSITNGTIKIQKVTPGSTNGTYTLTDYTAFQGQVRYKGIV